MRRRRRIGRGQGDVATIGIAGTVAVLGLVASRPGAAIPDPPLGPEADVHHPVTDADAGAGADTEAAADADAALPAWPRFVDVTEQMGLGPESDALPDRVARATLVDLDRDGLPDLLAHRGLVFLNRAHPDGGRRFVPVPPERSGLGPTTPNAAVIAVDLDGDTIPDRVVAESVDDPEATPLRSGWERGRGDGTFEPRRPLPVPPRRSIALAAGDVDRDGRLDLLIGNAYAAGLAGQPDDLLLNRPEAPGGFVRFPLPEEAHDFDPAVDAGPRPSYGAAILPDPHGDPMLVTLGYGRRWNRAYVRADDAVQDRSGEPSDRPSPPPPGVPASGASATGASASGASDVSSAAIERPALPIPTWTDAAAALGLDGDDVRHGRHPAWLAERARTDARFDRDDERPFRANGNTFDVAYGDVDGDGLGDVLLTEIAHAWAGDSSDRSRLLHATPGPGGTTVRWAVRPQHATLLHRPISDPQRWNEGDLFGALADLDQDGRLDVLLSSGDYPDDQRLRLWLQAERDRFVAATTSVGLDHDGSQQISLGDIDGDGDLDLVVGQTFNRFRADQREGRRPRLTVYRNDAPAPDRAVMIRVDGDGEVVNTHGIGTHITVFLTDGRRLDRWIDGPGGHAGKQHDFFAHFGLGEADEVVRVEIRWPDRDRTFMRLGPMFPGRYTARWQGDVERLMPPDDAP